jgi:hypothetical protein
VSVPCVYDAGALIAIESADRRMWAKYSVALEEGRRIIIPAVVVGQVWRDGKRQAVLARFLRSCEVEPTEIELAKAGGILCGKAGTSDLIDAVVVVTALRNQAIIFTSDVPDITKLSAVSGAGSGLVIRKV